MYFKPKSIEKLIENIFLELGSTKEEAEIIANHLIENNLLGYDSHGIISILEYAKHDINEGYLKLGNDYKIIEETDNIMIDAKFSPGPVMATKATRKAINLARKNGIANIVVKNIHHTGRLGAYTGMAAEENMIGFACVNWPNPNTMVVTPFGGKKGKISTNPISFACPRDKPYPYLVDMATSTVAAGRLNVFRNRKERIPDYWIIDKSGNFSSDVEDFYNGGALLPLGGKIGHKGFALSLIVEVLAGILSGNKPMQKNANQKGQGLFICIINIENYVPVKLFKEEIENLFSHVKDTPTMEGVDKIIIPGEKEYENKQINLQKGIYIDETTWEKIQALAYELKVNIESIVEVIE